MLSLHVCYRAVAPTAVAIGQWVFSVFCSYWRGRLSVINISNTVSDFCWSALTFEPNNFIYPHVARNFPSLCRTVYLKYNCTCHKWSGDLHVLHTSTELTQAHPNKPFTAWQVFHFPQGQQGQHEPVGSDIRHQYFVQPNLTSNAG